MYCPISSWASTWCVPTPTVGATLRPIRAVGVEVAGAKEEVGEGVGRGEEVVGTAARSLGVGGAEKEVGEGVGMEPVMGTMAGTPTVGVGIVGVIDTEDGVKVASDARNGFCCT